jgi:hypothetical protein
MQSSNNESMLTSTAYSLSDYDNLIMRELIDSNISSMEGSKRVEIEKNYSLEKYIQNNLRLTKRFFNQILKLNALRLNLIVNPSSIDGSAILPLLRAIEAVTDHIQVSIYLSEVNEVMLSQIRTNMSTSIPKLIGQNDLGEELFVWGPRTTKASSVLASVEGSVFSDQYTRLEEFYKTDLTKDIQEEWLELLRQKKEVYL